MIAIGDIVADKFRIDRVVGRGGMGMVVAATHVALGSTVALKFLRSKLIEQPTFAERFFREARATAVLKSQHVCHVFDVGTHDGMPYLVMELLEGTDLSKLLKQHGPLPVDLACQYLIQVCSGVAEAHAAKIVHRDLKPANLWLTTRVDASPLVKVLDFGIAKASTEANIELTQTDSILGSPAYMSLEQLRSSKLVDARSDIWSLGVTLFELVTGRRPYVGEGAADLALKIAMQPTPRLPPELAALDPVIGHCLRNDPAERFQSAAELAAALAPFANLRGSTPSIVRSRLRPGPATQAVTTPITMPTIALTTLSASLGEVDAGQPAPRRLRPFLVAGAAAIALGVALGIAATRGPDANHAASVAPPSSEMAPAIDDPVERDAAATGAAATGTASADASLDAPPSANASPEATDAEDIEIIEPRADPARSKPARPKPKRPKATSGSDYRRSRI